MSAAITRDEWLAALGDAVAPVDPDARTVAELAREFGISRASAYRRVLALVEAGRAIKTWKFAEIDGGAQGRRRVPAYKLVTPAKGRKR